jgi:hypothetical protein
MPLRVVTAIIQTGTGLEAIGTLDPGDITVPPGTPIGDVLTVVAPGNVAAFEPPSGGGGGGPSNLLYVALNGSDGTGTGSFTNPFATYGHAATVAVAGGAAFTNAWAVLFAPGSYAENVLLVPYVDLCGIDTGGSTFLDGAVNLNAAAWAGAVAQSVNVSNVRLLTASNLNFLAAGSTAASFVDFYNCYIGNNLSSEGTGVQDLYLIDCVLHSCALVASDINLITDQCTAYGGTNAVTLSAPSFGAGWFGYGSAFRCPVTANGAAGFAAACTLTGTSVYSTVTLNGPLATYSSTIAGVPALGVVLTGGATIAQYTILGELPPQNVQPSTVNQQVLTTVAGVSTWAAPSSGGGAAVSGAVPSAAGNLTLSIAARGNVGLALVPAGSGDNTVIQWDNAARPGFYLVPSDLTTTGATGLFNPANASVGGNPTVDFVLTASTGEGSYVVARDGDGVIGSMDAFLFLTQWTIGFAGLFTGTFAFNAGVPENSPTIVYASGNKGFGLICGLTAGLLVFGLWYVDSGAVLRTVQTAGVNPAVPHAVIGSYANGVLSLSVDGGAPVTAGPFPLPTFSSFVGSTLVLFGTETGEISEFVGSSVELDLWNISLTAPEQASLAAYYAGLL